MNHCHHKLLSIMYI